MPVDYDIIIVGAGLAGTCSALHLARSERILLLDARDPPAGASSAAAGLVNPFMARKARPTWRYAEALDALDNTLQLANMTGGFRQSGVLRPAQDSRQSADFRSAAEEHSPCRWLSAADSAERFPEIAAPHGALLVKNGGALGISAFIDQAIENLRSSGGDVRLGAAMTGFHETDDRVEVSLGDPPQTDRLQCRSLILACGSGFRSIPALAGLGLHAVKGQTADVRVPCSLSHLPHVAGAGYVVIGDDLHTVGSSFEHTFLSTGPDPEIGRRLVARASRMLPPLEDAEIVGHSAGLRVTVAGHRLPVVGPLPGSRRVWTLTGLGSKGLLMAPLIAAALLDYLRDPACIPGEIRLSA